MKCNKDGATTVGFSENQKALELNTMVCDFMKYEYQCEGWCGCNILEFSAFLNERTMRPFKPEEDWSDLMPIIIRIKSMQHDPKEMFMGTTLERSIAFNSVTSLPICTPIRVVYKSVTDFIQWYKNQLLCNKNKM